MAGGGGTILIADNDTRSREAVTELLRRAGYEATEAATGDEALRVALAERPVLVILEVELPGMSGYEVCRTLRETFGESLPILFVSDTRTEPLDRVAGLMVGGDDYIVKPFSPDALLSRVRRALLRSEWARTAGPHRAA